MVESHAVRDTHAAINDWKNTNKKIYEQSAAQYRGDSDSAAGRTNAPTPSCEIDRSNTAGVDVSPWCN